MSNETTEQTPVEVSLPEKISAELKKENITEAVIKELQTLKALTIAGVDDKAGYKAVDEARKKCKAVRVAAVKICKKGRESAVAIQKAWIAEEDRVESAILEVENDLEAKQKAIDAEKERIKAEEEAKETARIQSRIDELNKYGAAIDYQRLKIMADEDFAEELAMYRTAWDKAEAEKAEIERLAKLYASRTKELASVGYVYEPVFTEWADGTKDKMSKNLEHLTFDEYEAIFNAAIEAKETKDKVEAEEKERLRLQKEEQDKKDAELKEQARLMAEEQKKHDEANAAQAKLLQEQQDAANKRLADLEKAEADAKETILKTLIQPFIEMGFALEWKAEKEHVLTFKSLEILVSNIRAMDYKELAQFQGEVLTKISEIETAELKQKQSIPVENPELLRPVSVNVCGELVKELDKIDDIEFLSDFFGEDEMRQLSDNWSKKMELVVRVKEVQ